MRRPASIWIAISLAASLTAPAAAQKQTAVAVVDVQRAFDSLREKTSMEAQLQELADRIQAEDAARLRKIKAMDEKLHFVSPVRDTPERRRQEEELEMAALDRQVWLQAQQAKLNRERSLRIEALYKKLIARIGEVAQANGYQIVLFKEQPAAFARDATREQISAIIGSRKVLWAADEVDITDQIVVKLGGEFAK